jgi:hypothetical protein
MEKKPQVKICNKNIKKIEIKYYTTDYNNLLIMKHIMITSAFLGWGLLGFYRGQRDYDYEFSKINTSLYLYSCRMIYGIAGMCIYTFPLAWVIFIPIEIYRLEVYIRNLDEQNKEYYNRFLPF